MLLVAEQLRRRVPGGIGTYVRGLLQGLAELSDAPDVSLYASRPTGGPDALGPLGLPVVTSRLPGPVLTRLWDRAVVRAPGGYGVVQALSLAAPSAPRAMLVTTVHDVAWRHRPEDLPPRGRRWHEAALLRALERSDHFVVPSPPVAADLIAAGARSDAVTVVAFGADHLPVPDRDAATALLRHLGVAGEYLLSVGTIEPRKNLGRLFAAYGAARAALPAPWPLVVVGPAGWGPRAGPPATVSCCRAPVPAATLAGLYAGARLLAYVPLEEGYGLPPVEAMRMGTPVLTSPLPSVGSASLVVNPEVVGEISEGITRLAVDDALRARLVAAGEAHAAGLDLEGRRRRPRRCGGGWGESPRDDLRRGERRRDEDRLVGRRCALRVDRPERGAVATGRGRPLQRRPDARLDRPV